MNNFNAILIGLIVLATSVFIADKIIGDRGGTPSLVEAQAIAERIRPLGQVNMAPPTPPQAVMPTTTPALVSLPIAPPLATASAPPPPIPPSMEQKEQKVGPTEAIGPEAVAGNASDTPLSLRPPASVVEATQPEESIAPIDLVEGKKTYINACFACHETGAADAPKRGDQAAWQLRITQGIDTLLSHALNGINAMPPRGGNPTLTEGEIVMAIHYLIFDAEVNQ